MILTDAPDAGAGAPQDWTCSMHPDVHAPAPGQCPVCGMALVMMERTTEDMATEGHHHHAVAQSGRTDPMSDPVGFGMSREGSGTGWQPDATPMYMHHFVLGEWMWMLHYNAAFGFDDQTGPRGDRQWMSTNWVMLMAKRALGDGRFTGRMMLSLEPLTTGGAAGYPLLLQTGETAGGAPLRDRQHPHDLFMEVAAQYNQAMRDGLGIELYVAASGEPALGPVAFPHRVSAMYDPLAAIGHHWEDSTHVSFGVATLGIYTDKLKLEGSWFNGREPDENRYDFDFRPLDSFSTRLSFNPDARTSFQVSYGFLKSPEALDPTQSEQRVTASGTFDFPLGEDRNWATTVVFGRKIPSQDLPSNALLIESTLEWGADVVFGRYEYVEKNSGDLAVPGPPTALNQLGQISLGYVRNLPPIARMVFGVGVVGLVSLVPADLAPSYGGQAPLSGMIFVHLRPARL